MITIILANSSSITSVNIQPCTTKPCVKVNPVIVIIMPAITILLTIIVRFTHLCYALDTRTN